MEAGYCQIRSQLWIVVHIFSIIFVSILILRTCIIPKFLVMNQLKHYNSHAKRLHYVNYILHLRMCVHMCVHICTSKAKSKKALNKTQATDIVITRHNQQ